MRLGGVAVLVVLRAIHADKGPSVLQLDCLLQKLKYIGKTFAKMKILIERSQQGWIFQFVFSTTPTFWLALCLYDSRFNSFRCERSSGSRHQGTQHPPPYESFTGSLDYRPNSKHRPSSSKRGSSFRRPNICQQALGVKSAEIQSLQKHIKKMWRRVSDKFHGAGPMQNSPPSMPELSDSSIPLELSSEERPPAELEAPYPYELSAGGVPPDNHFGQNFLDIQTPQNAVGIASLVQERQGHTSHVCFPSGRTPPPHTPFQPSRINVYEEATHSNAGSQPFPLLEPQSPVSPTTSPNVQYSPHPVAFKYSSERDNVPQLPWTVSPIEMGLNSSSNAPSSASASPSSPGESYHPYSPSFPYTIECAHPTYFDHRHHHRHQQQQQQQQRHSTMASAYGYYSPKSLEEVGMAREPEGALPIGPNDPHLEFRDPFDDTVNHSGMSPLVSTFLENHRRLSYPNNDHWPSLGSFGYEPSSMHVSSPSPLQGRSHQAMPQQNMQTPAASVYASGTSQNGVEPTLIAPVMHGLGTAVVDLGYVSPPTQTSAQLSLAPSAIQCLYCEQTFTGAWNIGNRVRHVRLKHRNPEESNQDLTCQSCGKNYRRKDAKKKHEWKKHRKGRPPVKRGRTG